MLQFVRQQAKSGKIRLLSAQATFQNRSCSLGCVGIKQPIGCKQFYQFRNFSMINGPKQSEHGDLQGQQLQEQDAISVEFVKLFGKQKDEYIDSLVEMTPEELNQECAKHGLPFVQMHIQNLQIIIDYVNRQDKKIRKSVQGVEEDEEVTVSEDEEVDQIASVLETEGAQEGAQKSPTPPIDNFDEAEDPLMDLEDLEAATEKLTLELERMMDEQQHSKSAKEDVADHQEGHRAQQRVKAPSRKKQAIIVNTSLPAFEPELGVARTALEDSLSTFDLSKVRPEYNFVGQLHKKDQSQIQYDKLELIEQTSKKFRMPAMDRDTAHVMANIYHSLNRYDLLAPTADLVHELDNLSVLKYRFSKEKVATQLEKIVQMHRGDAGNGLDKSHGENVQYKAVIDALNDTHLSKKFMELLEYCDAEKGHMAPIYAEMLLQTQKMHMSKLNHQRSQAEYYLEKARINTWLQEFQKSERCTKDMKYQINNRIYSDTLVLTNNRYKHIIMAHLDQMELMIVLKSLSRFIPRSLSPLVTIQTCVISEILDQMIRKRSQLNIDYMIFLAQLCQQQIANRELRNKLMLAFSSMDFRDISLAKLKNFVEILFPKQMSGDFKSDPPAFFQGRLDKSQFLDRFILDYFNSSMNLQTYEDLHTVLDYCEFMKRYNPSSLLKMQLANALASNVIRLNIQLKLELEDQIRISQLFLDKTSRPHFFFAEILKNDRQNFARNVDPTILNKFIDEIVERADTSSNLFEHVNLLKQQQQNPFERMNEMSIRMLRKIVQQIMEDQKLAQSGKQSLKDESKSTTNLQILAKIFKSELVVKKYFANQEEMVAIIEPFIKHFRHYFKKNDEQMIKLTVASWHDFFDTISNFHPIVQLNGNQELIDGYNELFKVSLKALDDHVKNVSYQEKIVNQFEISDLFQINGRVLDLKTANSSLSDIYHENENLLHKLTSQIFKTFILSGLYDKQLQRGMSGGDHAQTIMSQRRPSRNTYMSFIENQETRRYYGSLLNKINSSLIYKESGSILSLASELSHMRDDQHGPGSVFIPRSKVVQFLQDIPNIRSIQGQNLNKLFQIVSNLMDGSAAENDGKREVVEQTTNQLLQRALNTRKNRKRIIRDCRRVLLLAATNLQTLDIEPYQDYSTQLRQPEDGDSNSDGGSNNLISMLNEQIHEQNSQSKQRALDMYTEMYNDNHELFKEDMASGIYNLAPLSKVLANKVEQLTHQEILTVLKILNHYDIHQIDRGFLQRLSERYSDMQQINELRNLGSSFFLDFVEAWPNFLKNDLFIGVILESSASYSVKEQSQAVSILAKKNILHSKLLKNHYETFTKMTDKASVKPILINYIKACAYLGHTEDFDIRALVQIYRRIFKTPQDCLEDINSLIDLILLIALQNYPYSQLFEPKSRDFIEKSLDYLDQHFAGMKSLKVVMDDTSGNKESDSTKTLTLNYIHGIQTDHKTFNKQLLCMQQKPYNAHKIFDYDLGDSFDLYKVQEKSLEEVEANLHKEAAENEAYDFIMPEEEDDDAEDGDRPANDFLKDSEHNEIQDDSEEGGNSRANLPSTIGNQSNVKSYNTQAKESKFSRFNEDLAYMYSRQMQLESMDKKEAHLYMFTNFDQLNQKDINRSQEVKVWAILYHYRNKSQDSQIFEEFNSVVYRNCLNKVRGHKMFQKFHDEMLQEAEQSNYEVELCQRCPISGWPIEIVIKQHGQSQNYYFFLQEEMCYNIEHNREQPLALQKLMMRHVQAAQQAASKQNKQTKRQATRNQQNQGPKYISETDLKTNYEMMKNAIEEEGSDGDVPNALLEKLFN